MSDNIQNSVTTPVQKPELTVIEQLHNAREEITKSQGALEVAKAAVDRQLSEAKQAKWKAEKEAELKELLIPSGDAAVLKEHDFVFMINNTKEAVKGPDSVLGASVAAAFRVQSLITSVTGKDANIAARFWGGRTTTTFNMDSRFGAKGYNAEVGTLRDFLPAAKEIMNSNTPDTLTGKQKHYVIICDGAITGEAANSVAVLEAAAKFNPKATFDFVVCNAADTAIDALVKQWSETASGSKPNLVKVGAPKEITGAVLKTLKARLAGEIYTPPAPVAQPASPVLIGTTNNDTEAAKTLIKTSGGPSGP